MRFQPSHLAHAGSNPASDNSKPRPGSGTPHDAPRTGGSGRVSGSPGTSKPRPGAGGTAGGGRVDASPGGGSSRLDASPGGSQGGAKPRPGSGAAAASTTGSEGAGTDVGSAGGEGGQNDFNLTPYRPGLSTGAWIGIGVGALALVGGLIWMARRRRNGGA